MERNSRGKWNSKSEYLLACIGYAVGLGNIWRFPYLCYKSGGGAFLIPYIVMLVFCGVPLLYMELSIGQLTRLGPVHAIAKLCPLLKGTGVAMVILSFILCTYYNVILSWALYYFFHSFQSPLPWKLCDHPWNSISCRSGYENDTVISYDDYNTTWDYAVNYTDYTTSTTFPGHDYFNNVVLRVSDGIDDMGEMRWSLVGFLFLAWVICYLCLCRGVRSVGKVVYVTATLPYLLLFILLVRGLTLPGAINGIHYFLVPKWEELLDWQVWKLAAVQNFNSIGIGFGSLIALSSYNDKNNNIMVDTFVIAIINSLTSLLAGFVVFSALGGLATNMGVSVSEVATAGPELVFVVLPSLFTQLPLPNLWSFFFFLMLICLGIDSQFTMVEVINTSLIDQFGEKLRVFGRWKEVLLLFICGVCFLLGLPHVTQGGIYFFTLVDHYAAVTSLVYVTYFEVMAVSWFYGANRLAREISFSSGVRPWYFFPFCWLFVSPVAISILGSRINTAELQYGNYLYPKWAHAIGYLISLASIICIPVGIIHTLCTCQGTCKEKFLQSITPTFIPEYAKRRLNLAHPAMPGIEMQPLQSVTQLPEEVVVEPTLHAADEDVMTPPDYRTAAAMEAEPLAP